MQNLRAQLQVRVSMLCGERGKERVRERKGRARATSTPLTTPPRAKGMTLGLGATGMEGKLGLSLTTF